MMGHNGTITEVLFQIGEVESTADTNGFTFSIVYKP